MFEEIKEILIEELGVEEEIEENSNLREDLEIDSMAAGELALQIDEKYGVDLQKEELVKLVTVKDLMDLLASKGIK